MSLLSREYHMSYIADSSNPVPELSDMYAILQNIKADTTISQDAKIRCSIIFELLIMEQRTSSRMNIEELRAHIKAIKQSTSQLILNFIDYANYYIDTPSGYITELFNGLRKIQKLVKLLPRLNKLSNEKRRLQILAQIIKTRAHAVDAYETHNRNWHDDWSGNGREYTEWFEPLEAIQAALAPPQTKTMYDLADDTVLMTKINVATQTAFDSHSAFLAKHKLPVAKQRLAAAEAATTYHTGLFKQVFDSYDDAVAAFEPAECCKIFTKLNADLSTALNMAPCMADSYPVKLSSSLGMPSACDVLTLPQIALLHYVRRLLEKLNNNKLLDDNDNKFYSIISSVRRRRTDRITDADFYYIHTDEYARFKVAKVRLILTISDRLTAITADSATALKTYHQYISHSEYLVKGHEELIAKIKETTSDFEPSQEATATVETLKESCAALLTHIKYMSEWISPVLVHFNPAYYSSTDNIKFIFDTYENPHRRIWPTGEYWYQLEHIMKRYEENLQQMNKMIHKYTE
jgi:hypothetical protein